MIKEYSLQTVDRVNNTLFDFVTLLDFEKCLRLNPYWTIIEADIQETEYSLKLSDYETTEEFEISGKLSLKAPSSYSVTLNDYFIRSFEILSINGTLHARVEYASDTIEEKDEARIVYWLRAIREYLRLYTKNSLYNRFFRLLMNKMIIGMSPSQRKICLMLYRITLLEIVAVIIIGVGYYYFGSP